MVSSIAIALISNNPNAIAVGPAIMQQQNLRYSRLFEKEADRVGFINLVNAGYNPNSMGEMFENMNDLRRLSGDLPPEFLLTHPLSSSRISDAFNAAENISEEGTKQDSLEFSLMKARLEIYYENIPANALRLFESKYAENPSDANLYGLALAYKKNNNFYFFDINPRLVTCIFKHCHWLATVMYKHLGAFQIAPLEIWLSIATGNEKSVHLVDLSEMQTFWGFTLIKCVKPLAKC